MEIAISFVTFFALVASWFILPSTARASETSVHGDAIPTAA